MKDNVRATIAAIALADSNSQKISGIYDYAASGRVAIDAEVQGDRVKAFDYSNSQAVEGSFPNLYHYGEGAYINIQRANPGKYTGYDYGAGSHFECTVSGSSAQLYDYGAGGYFSFSIS